MNTGFKKEDDTSGKVTYWSHVGILITGFLAGLVATYYFTSIKFDFTADILEARRIGITSVTILNGYSKSRDILIYISVLGLPVFFSVGLWFLWTGKERRRCLKELFISNQDCSSTKDVSWIVILVCMGILYLLSFNIKMLYGPNVSATVGGFPFLSEEGEVLDWVNNIISGQTYGKDFFCMYGPMLIYPLAWGMKIFGATIAVERLYYFFLNFLAYLIMIFSLYKTLKLRAVFVGSSFVLFIIFLPWVIRSLNLSYLRVALGLFPIFLSYIYIKSRSRILLSVIGVVAAQSLLFSQEVGLCSLVSLIAFFSLNCLFSRNYMEFAKEGLLIIAGYAISIVPMLIYFSSKGALPYFLDSFYGYPKLASLGFAALPFPDFHDFISHPLKAGNILPYWVIGIYAYAWVDVLCLLLIGNRYKILLLKISLLIFGTLLFRSALGRSDYYHVLFSSMPAFLLVFISFDGALALFWQSPIFMRIGRLSKAIVLFLSILLLLANSNLKANFAYAAYYLFDYVKEGYAEEVGYNVPGLYRSGPVRFDRPTALSIIKIRTFLETNTRAGDYVYFFPNEPAYYFLFDRKNPTRYANMYFAITRQQRLELVADLDKKRPEYIIYSRNTWRIDNIPEQTLAPEVVAFIKEKYEPVSIFEDVAFLKRRIGT